jgi:hypothetical protein
MANPTEAVKRTTGQLTKDDIVMAERDQVMHALLVHVCRASSAGQVAECRPAKGATYREVGCPRSVLAMTYLEAPLAISRVSSFGRAQEELPRRRLARNSV